MCVEDVEGVCVEDVEGVCVEDVCQAFTLFQCDISVYASCLRRCR